MILRRVMAHFRKQEWTAIAIDFVIVVMGVFIGIQVANWNDERAERRAEAVFLAALSGDIESELRTTEDFLDSALATGQKLKEAVLLAQDGGADAALTREQCDAAWRSHILSGYFSFNGLLSVDTLIQSRGIDIISNPTLQLALINYQSQMSHRANSARLIAADVRNLVDEYPDIFPRRITEDDEFARPDCKLGAISASQEVRNKLLSNHGRQAGIIGSLRKQIELLEELAKMVAEERNR